MFNKISPSCRCRGRLIVGLVFLVDTYILCYSQFWENQNFMLFVLCQITLHFKWGKKILRYRHSSESSFIKI